MRRRFFKGAIRNDCIIFEVLNGFISFGLSRNPIEYSLDDGISWMKLNAGELTPTYTNIPRVLIKCTPTYIGLIEGIGSFTVSGEFNLGGNVMALLGGHHHLKENIFYNLFKETNVVNVSKTFLPATTLAESCYRNMFYGCTNLTTAPELPATTLANSCYRGMFNGCSSLTTAPELPATTLANSCYEGMFSNTALTTAPELPATTLASRCYNSMFYGCTSLTTAPELPATTLASYCYNGMFYLCYELNYIKMLATDISASNCLDGWVYAVARTGTFVKNPAMTTLPTGISGIPSGWTVINDGEESGGSNLTFPVTLVEGVNDSEYVLKFFDWARNLPLTGYEINEGVHIFRNYALNNSNSDLGYPNDGFPLLYDDFRNVIRININEGEFYINGIFKSDIYEDCIKFNRPYILNLNTDDSIVSNFSNIMSVRLYLNGNLTIERGPTAPPVITPPVFPS